jgi:hypothetical protein
LGREALIALSTALANIARLYVIRIGMPYPPARARPAAVQTRFTILREAVEGFAFVLYPSGRRAKEGERLREVVDIKALKHSGTLPPADLKHW